MPDPTAEFFDQLGRRGHERLLETMEGTIRFDLKDDHGTDHWFVAVDEGDVRVSRESGPADCVIHTDRALFDRIVTGETQAQAAWLRHQLVAEGDPTLHRQFDRIFPGPATARHPRDFVARDRRRR
jgi:putative sterol carrier protein